MYSDFGCRNNSASVSKTAERDNLPVDFGAAFCVAFTATCSTTLVARLGIDLVVTFDVNLVVLSLAVTFLLGTLVALGAGLEVSLVAGLALVFVFFDNIFAPVLGTGSTLPLTFFAAVLALDFATVLAFFTVANVNSPEANVRILLDFEPIKLVSQIMKNG